MKILPVNMRLFYYYLVIGFFFLWRTYATKAYLLAPDGDVCQCRSRGTRVP